MKERDLQRKIREHFIGQGCIVLKLTTLGRYGSGGWPDLLVLQPGGHALFIEVKQPKGALTALQKRRLDQLKAFGFKVFVMRSMEDLEELHWRGW